VPVLGQGPVWALGRVLAPGPGPVPERERVPVPERARGLAWARSQRQSAS